jgi:hypothetical protein
MNKATKKQAKGGRKLSADAVRQSRGGYVIKSGVRAGYLKIA